MKFKLIHEDDLLEYIYDDVDKIFIGKHRWYNSYNIIFKIDEEPDKFYSVYYMEPASECQDGQDRFNADKDGMVECYEVVPVKKIVEITEWKNVDEEDL